MVNKNLICNRCHKRLVIKHSPECAVVGCVDFSHMGPYCPQGEDCEEENTGPVSAQPAEEIPEPDERDRMGRCQHGLHLFVYCSACETEVDVSVWQDEKEVCTCHQGMTVAEMHRMLKWFEEFEARASMPHLFKGYEAEGVMKHAKPMFGEHMQEALEEQQKVEEEINAGS
jgi:hypothetical protein